MKDFFKIRFAEDEKGHIHIFTDILNKDDTGFFFTMPQYVGIFALLDQLKKTIKDNVMEDSKWPRV